MGTASSGIIVLCNPNDYTYESIVDYFFGAGKETYRCDNRDIDCLYLGKLANGIFIGNADFANLFFSRNAQALDKINKFFRTPALAFAFNWFDSGGTYGYVIIENGETKRVFRSISYEKLESFGNPVKGELSWFSSEPKVVRYEPHPAQFIPPDFDFNIKIFTNSETGEEISEYGLPERLLPYLMINMFDFDIHFTTIAQEKFYKLSEWIGEKYNAKPWL
jgi:hypothetical protein